MEALARGFEAEVVAEVGYAFREGAVGEVFHQVGAVAGVGSRVPS